MDKRPAIVTGLWGISVVIGIVAMTRYQTTPGAAATPPHRIPLATVSTENSARMGKLLVFLHPQCGCSRATVDELDRIEAKAGKALDTTIYFYKPSSEPDSWCKESTLWMVAKDIPGVSLRIDVDAHAAKKFGARCSGEILLYASNSGRLLFSGGITPGRGHEGESAGGDSILAFSQNGRCPLASTPVYGCAIWSDLDSASNTTIAPNVQKGLSRGGLK